MKRRFICSLAMWITVIAGAVAQVSPDTPGWFPFVMSPLDTPGDSPIDLSSLNQPGTQGRITVKGPHFVDPKGERVRFLGTNVTFSSAFPDQEHAPAVARRLAQLGFNVVRFHHLDSRDIWKSPAQDGFDPEKLDRMDFFIAELKKNGIYVNMNLHVSRTYPGLREMNLVRAFRYGKLVDKFYEPYIRLQETYASDLLDRENPHTGLSYLEDPAIAFVELNNENSLLQLRPDLVGELGPDHRVDLQKKWGQWLKKHYGTVDEVVDRWNRGVTPLQKELLKNGGFAKGLDDWYFQKSGKAEAKPAAGPGGGKALHLRLQEKGKVSWAYQLHQTPLPARNETDYTFQFRARAATPRDITCHLRFAVDPWSSVSPTARFKLTPEWKTYSTVLRVNGVQPDIPIRLSMNLGDEPGEAWITDASLRKGRKLFEAPGGTALKDLPLPGPKTPAAGLKDFRLFLIETERAYVTRMREHLADMGCQSLIVDTQASYGGYWGLHREASLNDFIDIHAYWQHPRFPNKPWDSNDWNIPNTSMLEAEDGGTFAKLARYRLEGKPYSVSEYNHPSPNDQAAELFPMLASFAAYQDWDAIYQFCYGNRSDHIHEEKIGGYFNLARQSAQLVFAPAAALMFREGLLEPAPKSLTVNLPGEAMNKALLDSFPSTREWLGEEALPAFACLTHRTAIRFDGKGDQPAVPPIDSKGDALISGGQVIWKLDPAIYTVNAPALRAALGKVGGSRLSLGDTGITLDLPEGTWACVVLATLDSKPIAESDRLLLSVATRVENTNMGWDEKRSTVGRKWGAAPVVAQGVPGTITLPGGPVKAWALNPAGQKAVQVKIGDGNRMKIGPEYKTLWYVIERE